ncbi:TetR/AcrR family transcriptional regulator [Methylocapsa sp. S129]|uniref:TetR/AcrR family transcriptional regulator n=1 Tax=Methylocapsa sp. S129 TaxID=1641869 RepID=UPI001AEE08A0|nr:TetR/AcrR family transcriptional regulator [Methylocapsa sp. S129]
MDDVKTRMVQKAALSLAAKGLQRSSFSEVLKASGAPRGSLYHHFPGGKEELVLDALDLAADWAMKALGDMAGRPAIEVAQGFIDLWRRILAGSHFGSGCAIAAVTIAAEAPELLNRAATIFRNWVSHIGALLAEGGVPEERAPALATLLISACEGAVILSRAEQSFGPLDRVAAELMAAIAAAQQEKSEG